MINIEQKFKHKNRRLMNDMKKLEQECDSLIQSYQARIDRIELTLCKPIRESRRHIFNKHRVATAAKLGAFKAFKAILQREVKSLAALNNPISFNQRAFQRQFTASQKIVCQWATAILAKEAPWQLKHQYYPFSQLAKRIGNFILPFTLIAPFIKKAVHGSFFFTTKTNTQHLAEKAGSVANFNLYEKV